MFVKDFAGNASPTLDALQEQLQSDDHTFIDKLMYVGKVVPESSAYWKSKKVDSCWINHHIEKDRVAPNEFMALSCAEYLWPDLKRLLEEYIFTSRKQKS
jgi:hypothetical protein